MITDDRMLGKSVKTWDPILLWLSLAATVLGLLAIYDSGYARSAADGMVVPREFRSQVVSAIVAITAGVACWSIPKKNWKSLAGVVFVLSVLALIAVKFVGTEINGARRWIDLKIVTIQPAEFAKFSVILLLAAVLGSRKATQKPPRVFAHWAEKLDFVWVPRVKRSWPFLLAMVAAFLVVIEPDLATAMVIVVVSVLMLIMGGVSTGSITTIGVLGILIVGTLVVKEPYRMERILHHGDRWSQDNIEGIGYQTTQSEAAMAKGAFFGVGLGEGRAKHTLPAPTTDFIMATVAEETGLVGVIVVMGVMGGLTWRLFVLSRQSEDKFSRLVLGGLGTWIGIQACTNIVMANGSAPPIGVPMPFISAGGSSLMATWMALGVSQSVLKNRTEEATNVETSRNRRWHRRPRVSRA